ATDQARLGRAPGLDHGGLRARESPPELVPRRSELPGRAPLVSAHLPRALPLAGADRRGDLPRALRPVSRRADVPQRAPLEPALAPRDGRCSSLTDQTGNSLPSPRGAA